jgi:hypothetical protein
LRRTRGARGGGLDQPGLGAGPEPKERGSVAIAGAGPALERSGGAGQFVEEDERVLVAGSIRVVHPDGSFAETMVRWIYTFRDDRVERLFWEPRAGY